jgi:2-dehydro-3-deoxygluconokinase
MLRLDPGRFRITSAPSFRVWEGGAEYNVARNLHSTFGRRTSVLTALVANPIGGLLKNLISQGGVDQSHVVWREFDGIGRAVRNGLNFTERGFGIRAAVSCSDRGHTAVAQITPDSFDWDDIFGVERARWFHTGGIFAALSESTQAAAHAAMRAARRHGSVVSFDLNYRDSLWRGIGGPSRAREVNRGLVSDVDFIFGNEEDYTAALGYDVGGIDPDWQRPDLTSYSETLGQVLQDFPNLKAAVVTLRHASSATRNDWSALCVVGAQTYASVPRNDLEVYDRVGGGDGFVAGFIEALLSGADYGNAVEVGAALGALTMTTPGDCSLVSAAEVAAAVLHSTVRIQR